MATSKAGVWNMVKIAKRIGIVQRSVFGEAFDVVAALHLMEADLIAKICPGDDVSIFVKIHTPSIAAPFSKEFKFLG